MKTLIRLFASVAVLLVLSTAQAATVVVTANDAESFRDVRLSSMDEEDSLKIILEELREHLQTLAKRYLEEGQTLEVNFTDIDLAGEIEPWHSPRYNDVRWVRDLYIPRLKFDFKLTNADGTVVAEGSANRTDLAFMWNVNTIDRSNTKYEKPLLSDWVRTLRSKG